MSDRLIYRQIHTLPLADAQNKVDEAVEYRDAVIRAAHGDGLSVRFIADLTGLHRRTVTRIISTC